MKAAPRVLAIDIGGTNVKILAAGQAERRKFPSALGSYKGGTMLFLGLGTGLGSALMVRGHIVPMELGALSFKNKAIEDYLGARGLQKLGKKKWRKAVAFWVKRFTSALLLDNVVIGGGHAKKLKQMLPGCRLGSNANAFLGGFRMWEPAASRSQWSRDDQPKKAKGGRT